jgi:hypothetical protein
MKIIAFATLAILGCTSAFTSTPALSFTRSARTTPLQAYVPDGLTAEQYKKIKEADKKKIGKDLGRLGPRGFKSRSMQAWQEAYERGEASHSFAPIGYREKLQRGILRKEDVPYMVRGGSWDNSDVRGAKKLRWSKQDREYAKGGYRKEQSVSILGSGPGFDWTGTQTKEERGRKLVPGLS